MTCDRAFGELEFKFVATKNTILISKTKERHLYVDIRRLSSTKDAY